MESAKERIQPPQFYNWQKQFFENDKAPRDHWLLDEEKPAIIRYHSLLAKRIKRRPFAFRKMRRFWRFTKGRTRPASF